MKMHRSTRAKAKSSILRKWLGKTMHASQSPIDSRPLLCERLERRYALHGMGWFAESSEGFEYAEVEYGEDPNTGNSFAQVRTWQAAYQTSVRPVARYRDSYFMGEASAFDASFEDMFDEPCDRPKGAKPEGEGPGSPFSRGYGGGGETTRSFLGSGSIYDQLSTKPQPKISDWTAPKFDLSNSDPVGFNKANTSVNTTASHVANDTAIQVHVTAQAAAPTMGPASTAPATPRLIDFTTGGRGLATTQSASVSTIGRNSFTASASVVNRADASPSLTNSSNQVTTLASSNSQLSRPTTSATAASTLSSTDNDAWVTIGNSWQNDRPGTVAEGSTKSERDTEGLLSELRAVIEKLANDQATGKAGPGSSARANGSLGGRATEEFFSSNRRRMFDDGMLELAATNHPLSAVVASGDVAGQLAGETHRSQLIASLELNREFDLAGQSVQSFKSVIDPTTRVHDASLAAEEFENIQFNASAGLSAKPIEAESTLWQRSILPLSFLAIGSLLMRSRKKYFLSLNFLSDLTKD